MATCSSTVDELSSPCLPASDLRLQLRSHFLLEALPHLPGWYRDPLSSPVSRLHPQGSIPLVPGTLQGRVEVLKEL